MIIGTRLGPYEILSAIGAGGMGEVYRARDTKLSRDVALKILPETFATDPERLARFKREAQVLASLNHPNIAAIYGFEDSSSTHALVLELVEGFTLADRITKGPLPLDEALPIAKQIAEALEAAHEQGIIHRDLKPANIKLSDDGRVKVLDFGLAKALEPPARVRADVTNSPTITSPALMTGVGMLLGTAAYMSPEQAKGRPADKRSDIWAFGCVLYEMLAGRRAFDGDDVSDTLAAVLRGEPDWARLPSDTPAAILVLVKRCLERDRSQRVGDIAAALFVLRDPAIGSERTSKRQTDAPRSAIRRVTLSALIAVLAVAITSLLWGVRRSEAPLPIVTRFSVPLQDGQLFSNPEFRSLAISPDGSRIAYVVNRQLLLRSMSDPTPKVLVADSGDALGNPAFSPDSQSIVFWSGTSGFTSAPGALKRIAVGGGVPVPLCSTIGWSFGISWDATGILFTQPGKGILRVSPDGGAPSTVVEVDAGATNDVAAWPSMLPDGETVLFTLAALPASAGVDAPLTMAVWDAARVEIQSLRTKQRKTLFAGGSDAHYIPTGHLVYAVGGNLFARPFDLKNLHVSSGPASVLEGVLRTAIARTSTGAAQFSVSEQGSTVYVAGPTSSATADRSQLVLVDRSGRIEPLKLPAGLYERPRLSPDGRQLAVSIDDGKSTQVWVYDLSGSSPLRQLTFDGNNRIPLWAPDGEHITFTSDRDGDLGIFLQRSDGTTKAERLTKAEAGALQSPESWSRDGARLMFTSMKTSGGSQTHTLWILDVKRREASPFGDVRSFRLISPEFSPDGRWVAYSLSNRAGNQVIVQPFPATGSRVLVGHGNRPQWSRDGKELFFHDAMNGNKTFVVGVRTQPTFEVVGLPVELPFDVYGGRGPGFGRDTDVFPDGRRFIAALSVDAATAAARPRQMNVVLNWTEELKQRVPVK